MHAQLLRLFVTHQRRSWGHLQRCTRLSDPLNFSVHGAARAGKDFRDGESRKREAR